MSHQALLLDRDGTLVHARAYPRRPEELVLYEGLAPVLRDFQGRGWRLVLVTNQAGIARGYFSEADLALMHEALAAMLARDGVRFDAIYHCPHHTAGVVERFAIKCECRKPAPGMLLQAARDLDLDLARSWFVGDVLDDVEAGRRAGCRTVLVDLGSEGRPPTALRTPDAVARNTLHGLALIADLEGFGPASERNYRPARWYEHI